MLCHPLINFEIQRYYCQDKPRFNGVYSRISLPKIKDGAYIINIGENKSIGTNCIPLYVEGSHDLTYFDSFGVEHIPKEIKKCLDNRKIKHISIQEYDECVDTFALDLLILC